MHRLYALQQRIAITSPETSALLFVVLLFLTGFCVRYVQGQSAPYAPEHYAALDSTFAARTAPPPSDAAADSSAAVEADVPAPAVVEARVPRRPAAAGPVRMNINTASEALLQRLPGIGPKMAARITEYRAAHGDFARPRDVIRVKGIGPKTYEKLAPYLYVEEAESDAADGS